MRSTKKALYKKGLFLYMKIKYYNKHLSAINDNNYRHNIYHKINKNKLFYIKIIIIIL